MGGSLRVEKQAGHGIGSSRCQLDEEMADILAVVLRQTVPKEPDARNVHPWRGLNCSYKTS